ncbi:polyphenol oxidase I, chloroplastic [Lolium perenne]|uniref:polyphenol oxidase I, chloroplastic n=1 Tax=Lolium perenne TaxID=4522 RepID=UPI0021F56FF1|nr:polyphenol oxidase I, chloroplastic-like [Lolium perenne]
MGISTQIVEHTFSSISVAMSSASSFVCSPIASASSGCLLPPSKHGTGPSIGKLQGRRLSCRAAATSGSGGDENQQVRRNIDRRDVLFGLSGFAAVTSTKLGLALAADAEPVCASVPITAEVLKCSLTDDFDCPAEYDATKVIDFKSLPLPSGPPRVRRPAHELDDAYVKKFEEAIRRMKELDEDDPRSYYNQSGIHEAYCDKHYNVVSSGSPDVTFDVHFSSIFAPWHRMYIYFFERILGDLIGDPTFALPYWNWDSPEGMMLPSIFLNESSPLFNANRNQAHLRSFMDLNLGPAKQKNLPEPECTGDALCLLENNLYSMYRQMTVDTPEEFFGNKFCAFDAKFTGSLENGAHTAAHIWAGGDMGSLKTAARDPVFYCNHSNVDRMWHLWTTTLGRDNLPYKEWLDTSFVFYDEMKRPVRISVQDVLDNGKLGYTYQEKRNLEWLQKRPVPSTVINRPVSTQKPVTPASSFPLTLNNGQNQYVTVARPQKAQAAGGSSRKAPEVLVFDLTVDPCQFAKFNVLLNVPRGQEGIVGPKNSEYVGSFMYVPHSSGDDDDGSRFSRGRGRRDRRDDDRGRGRGDRGRDDDRGRRSDRGRGDRGRDDDRGRGRGGDRGRDDDRGRGRGGDRGRDDDRGRGRGDRGRMMENQDVSYRLNLREIIADLNCGRDTTLDITIVPIAGEKTLVNSLRVDIL